MVNQPCKIIDHVLRYNKFKTILCGNIGQPILNKKIKKRYDSYN